MHRLSCYQTRETGYLYFPKHQYMRKFLVVALGLTVLAGNAAFAQRTCGTVDRQEALLQSKPKLAAEKANYEARMRGFQQNALIRSQKTVITIPVVVHVVYGNSTQNV